MTSTLTLVQAEQLAVEQGKRLHGLRLPNDARSRFACACFAVVQQHHSAILILLQRTPRLEATAFALLRPTLEAALRGEWVLHCATDDQVKNFAFGGKKQVDMSSVVLALQRNGAGKNAHNVLYKNLWPILSAYTHTYEHQVQHWLSPDGITPDYPEDQIAWLITNSTACLNLCVSSVCSMAIKDEA